MYALNRFMNFLYQIPLSFQFDEIKQAKVIKTS